MAKDGNESPHFSPDDEGVHSGRVAKHAEAQALSAEERRMRLFHYLYPPLVKNRKNGNVHTYVYHYYTRKDYECSQLMSQSRISERWENTSILLDMPRMVSRVRMTLKER